MKNNYYIVFFTATSTEGDEYKVSAGYECKGLLSQKVFEKDYKKAFGFVEKVSITNFIKVSKKQCDNWNT